MCSPCSVKQKQKGYQEEKKQPLAKQANTQQENLNSN